LEYFTRAKTVEQHQRNNGKITKVAETLPETGNLVEGEGHDHAAGLSHAQAEGDTALAPPVSQRRA
jgi:hypothetical protein